jgi:hypothetical protein
MLGKIKIFPELRPVAPPLCASLEERKLVEKGYLCALDLLTI